MESWEVSWRNERDQEIRREFATFLEAWTYNETELRGRGEVVLLTDRPLPSDRRHPARSEAEAARRQEGKRRYVRRSGNDGPRDIP